MARKAEGFCGLIPPKALFRFMRLYMAGLVDYHEKYYAVFMKRMGLLGDYQRRTDFRPPNLQGNISVIFLTLVAGFIPSVVAIMLEILTNNRKKIWNSVDYLEESSEH